MMTPEAWTGVGTGVVILIAIATSNRQLRGEMNRIHGESASCANAWRSSKGSSKACARPLPVARSP